MRLPNETEEQVVLIGGLVLVVYFLGKGLIAVLSKAWATLAGQPMTLADGIEIPGTGQTAGALRAIGYTNDQINTLWQTAVEQAQPGVDPGQYGIFVGP